MSKSAAISHCVERDMGRRSARPMAAHEPGDRPDPSSGITVGDARLLAVYFHACPPLFSLNGELPHD
jgi:hypothetical protein